MRENPTGHKKAAFVHESVCIAKSSLGREPSALTNREKAEYILAEQCLLQHPVITDTVEGARTVWDELHQTHIWQGNYIHYVGHFLPWHRYLVRAHEILLQTLCGYSGAQPYWDELTDWESAPLREASIFDPVFGFGGDGVGADRCIQDGPFRDTTLRMHLNGVGEYCISRQFNQTLFEWADRREIAKCFAITNYTSAWECYNLYVHAAGHAAVGGVMFDTVSSNGDPIFYLHHAYLDRLWWQWQQADQARRLYDIGGPNVPPQAILDTVGLSAPSRMLVDYAGDAGNTTTLNHNLWVHGLVPNVTIAEVMDLGGEVICARYD
ncbi:hypothetical protein BJY04DRAFT_219301 [Aspergillus karnatakaensis]|uniref:tyrosinase family protein n=1 Tax=Aspergillus karnatakaensis TaxID=1810916 RepID=UPI003CCDAC6A